MLKSFLVFGVLLVSARSFAGVAETATCFDLGDTSYLSVVYDGNAGNDIEILGKDKKSGKLESGSKPNGYLLVSKADFLASSALPYRKIAKDAGVAEADVESVSQFLVAEGSHGTGSFYLFVFKGLNGRLAVVVNVMGQTIPCK